MCQPYLLRFFPHVLSLLIQGQSLLGFWPPVKKENLDSMSRREQTKREELDIAERESGKEKRGKESARERPP
jgi:hypothetical protein